MPGSDIKKAVDRGHAASCGCGPKGRPPLHGMSHHPLYAVHQGMVQRCTRPWHKAWKDYGGRGIRVCERWVDFRAFVADVGASYSPGLTLDRRDNDGDYEPGNCRWATPLEQHNNTRANTFIVTPRGGMTLAQAARAYVIPYSRMLGRLAAGWSLQRALGISETSTTPPTAAPEAASLSQGTTAGP